MADTRGCRAKDPYDCRYHGALLRMEQAQATGMFDMYAEAKAEFDAEERKRRLFPFFFGEKPVGEENPAKLEAVGADPHRFSGYIEIHPEEETIGIYKKIRVTAPTREEVYDKLVTEAKKFADKMRKELPKSRSAELNRELRCTISAPSLRGEKDTDNIMASSPVSINRLTHWAHMTGGFEKDYFNNSVMMHRTREGTWNADDNAYMKRNSKASISNVELTEEELLLPEYRMSGNVIPLREPHEGDHKWKLAQLRKSGIKI